MARKKNDTPTGFEDILNNVYGNAENTEEVTVINEVFPQTDPIDDDEIINEPPVNTEDGEKVDDTVVVNDDNSEIPENVIDNSSNQTTETKEEEEKNDNPSDEDVAEAQQVGLLFDSIIESFGWNAADIDEKDRPLTVDDLTNYLKETVRQNSVPNYADERIQALDEYVKNGGNFEDFYRIQQEGLNLESMNLEDENAQKQVVRELLKYDGYTDEQINKRISRYEDADMLYEESEDALDRLKAIRKREAEQEALRQEAAAKAEYEKSQQFFNSVSQEINSLNSIRGITIPKEDRKALFDYIFKVDQNGLSQYQKDFQQNLSKNLIESAYFTMKGDTLLSGAEHKGETSATEKLRKMLRHTTKNHSSYNADDKQKSVTDLLAGQF